MKFLLSSNPVHLAFALKGKPSATVEAEYGDIYVPGSIITMAHHEPRAGQPAPCSYKNGVGKGVEVVGLSHVDLDTLGGCMALLGDKPEVPGFWELAEFVDLNGPHKIAKFGASQDNIYRLNAFWAWSNKNRVMANRDGSVSDVTDQVWEGVKIISLILSGDTDLITDGVIYAEAEKKLNKNSFVEAGGGVVVRVSDKFVSHLYVDSNGVVNEAAVVFNTTNGAITVSFADKPTGTNACEIVQSLWGVKAGGHAGIAGSPRDQRMNLNDLVMAVEATKQALKN